LNAVDVNSPPQLVLSAPIFFPVQLFEDLEFREGFTFGAQKINPAFSRVVICEHQDLCHDSFGIGPTRSACMDQL